MKNIEYLEKLRKKFKIATIICRILVLPLLILVGVTAPTSTTLATIIIVLFLIALITGLILDKKIRQLDQQIYDVGTITQAIEDSKN